MSHLPPADAPVPGLLRSATVYGVANVLQRAIPVLLLPVLTYYLSAADVGLIAVFTAAVGLAGPFVGVNVPYAIRRRYFDGGRDFPAYVTACLSILAAGTALVLLLCAAAGPVLARVSGLPAIWLAAAVLLAAMQELLMVPLTIWQVQHRPDLYAWAQVARAAGVTVLTATFVMAFGLGWQGAAGATVLAGALFAVGVAAPALRRHAGARLRRADVLHALRYGGGLIPHTLGSMGMRTIDRFIVAYYAGAAENGLYWVGYQIGFVVSLASDAFVRAWTPWLYGVLQQNDETADRRVVRVIYVWFAALLAGAVLVSLAAPAVVPYVLAAEFHPSMRFVWWIALGFAFNGMYAAVAGFVFYSERTMLLSWITGVSALASVGLNVLLVPRLGAMGAAQAAAGAFLLKFLLTWVAAERVRPMPWRQAVTG